MPPKRRRVQGREEADGAVVSKRPRKKGAWKMPPPLPAGEVLSDFDKKQWVLGTSVGKGGFGEIYLAAPRGSSASVASAEHVIKIEPHENGPLFTELSFYRRAAKLDLIEQWVKERGMSYLAVPKYISSGCHLRDEVHYRFLVMERFGEDVEKLFCKAGRQFGVKTVCYLALRLLEAMEYLHEREYVHADIKGSNLLTGFAEGSQHKVYLVDYGLAYRFNPCGKHKKYQEDPRRQHDGTIEFTSIDAHKGVSPSRRGDLEILGYCLLQWACGRLPWEDNLENKPYVAEQKIRFKSDPDRLMKACSTTAPVTLSCLREYMKIVYRLGYEDQPNYNRLKGLFHAELSSRGLKDDGIGLDWLTSKKHRSTDESSSSPLKKLRCSPRQKNPERGFEPSVKGGRRKRHVDTAGEAGPSADILPEVSYPVELGYDNCENEKEAVVHRKKPPRGSKRARRVEVIDSSDEETLWAPSKVRSRSRHQVVGKSSPWSRTGTKHKHDRKMTDPIELSDSTP